MRNKVLIALILLAVLLFISVIFQVILGIFKIGFWVGIILTLIVIGFILSRLSKRNKPGTN
ncbi:MAG: hypothetical protein K0S32_935 [Bacteroidetes bacterium]|jgi:hypothetical protein|nr:hypothetical protein [Bacteroidota bacterium]